MKEFNFNVTSIDIESIFIFADLESFLNSCKNFDEVLINMKNISWFNSALSSIFWAILRKYVEEKGLKIKTETNLIINKVLKTNGFFDIENIDIKKNRIQRFFSGDNNDTYIQVKKFIKGNNEYFLKYIEKSLNNRHFTDERLLELIGQLAEIFSNFEIHSNSQYFYVSGQCFPRKKYIDICLTDKGEGLAKKVLNKEINIITEQDGIEWAFKGNNTTKLTFGGFGLKFLKEFIENKKGILIVYCNHTCYNIINNMIKEYNNEFLGTSIFIRLPNSC